MHGVWESRQGAMFVKKEWARQGLSRTVEDGALDERILG